MSEQPTPGTPQGASEPASQALTSEAVSAILADFRAWLTALTPPPPPPSPTRGEGEKFTPSPLVGEGGGGGHSAPSPLVGEGGGGGEDTIDLHTLLGQFLAVRQEVNLQTRAVRAQQQQNAETLQQLTAALDALRQSQAQDEQMQDQAIDEAIRPLLKTLVDLYDALALAGREMQRLRETVLPRLDQLSAVASAAPQKPPSLWARLFRSPAPTEPSKDRQSLAGESAERVRQMLASFVTGYTMSLQRIERALRQHGLEAIPTEGERFDPERMEAIEAVANSGRPSGEVVEESRRGYTWNGRVFRYAQVRVAKGQ